MQSKITLIGMHEYLYDPDTNPKGLFSTLTVPTGTLDPDTLASTILLRGGEFEVLYPNPDFMLPMISVWSAKWAETITRWYKAFTAEYDPISNYDRHEEWTDTGTGSGTGTGTSSGTTGGTSARDVSSYDAASDYIPSEKTTDSATSSGNTSSSYNNSTSDIHKGHLYGNIGVTTNQQMIEAEFNLFKTNLYNAVADLFLTEFVIPVR